MSYDTPSFLLILHYTQGAALGYGVCGLSARIILVLKHPHSAGCFRQNLVTAVLSVAFLNVFCRQATHVLLEYRREV